jgi:hypothetical protein
MKYIKKFESFRKTDSINEELLDGVLNFFKNMWNKAVEEIKKLGKNPSPEQIEEWIDKNPLNPKDDSYILKAVMDEFNKKPEANEQDCLDLVKNILDPQVGSLGKQGLQTLYDGLTKSFGKDIPTLDIVKFYFETIRNRAIKTYKYAGGPDLKVGIDPKIDPKKIITDVKDTTHLPDFKKLIVSAKEDNKKKKQIAIDWVNKTLVPTLDKYLSEIKDEEVDKYIESLGKDVPGGGDYKVGDTVIYKREKFKQDEWDKLTDVEKSKPNDGKMKELQKEQIGIKKISKIEGDKISFEGADFTKVMVDILMKSEENKSEEQKRAAESLGKIKSDPEKMNKVAKFADFLQDEKNKDKIEEIDKLLGGE